MQHALLAVRTLALSFALFATCQAAFAGQLLVTLKTHAEVQVREVKLHDVALIEGGDVAALDALQSLQVGQVPANGRPVPLTRAELARHVARQLPHGVTKVEWQGSEAVQVQLQVIRVDAKVLIDRAAADLRAALAESFDDVQLRIASRPDALRLPAGDLVLHTHLPKDAAALPQRRMRVDVDVRVAGVLVRTLPLWFEVQAHAPRWVALRDLPAGEALSAGDFERRTVDVAKAGSPDVDLPSDVAGWRLSKAMRLGSVLSSTDIEETPWVRRQDDVTVEVRSAGVVIESRGTALADGRVGDVVAVRISGAELVRGRVVGPKRLAL